MPHRTLYGAMLGTLAGVVLLSLSSALASAWPAQIMGSMTTTTSVSQTRGSEASRDAGGHEGQAVPGGTSPRLVISAVILSLLLGMVIFGSLLGIQLGYRRLRERSHQAEKKREIEQLTEQFQALFRQLDQQKNP